MGTKGAYVVKLHACTFTTHPLVLGREEGGAPKVPMSSNCTHALLQHTPWCWGGRRGGHQRCLCRQIAPTHFYNLLSAPYLIRLMPCLSLQPE